MDKEVRQLIAVYIGCVVICILFLVLFQTTRAAGFEWHIDCSEMVEDTNQHHVWVGYTADQDYPDSFGYSGNGPGIYFSDFIAGEHDKAIDVLTDYGDVTLYGPDGAEITITSETEGVPCNAPTGLLSGQLDKDDNGVVNNSANPRANTCFGSGQVCDTEQEWIAGYYLFIKQHEK